MNILVTGASGFIGNSILRYLHNAEHSVRAHVRQPHDFLKHLDIQFFVIDHLNASSNWSEALIDVDCVIHCAAQVPIFGGLKNFTQEYFIDVNLEGTKRLAEQALISGVKRFIYISSIKVNELLIRYTPQVNDFAMIEGKLFNENIHKLISDAYAVSKFEAEQALIDISAKSDLEIVIIRPPLVYGPGVKGSFYSMLKLLSWRIPLPFSAIDNKRSYIGIDNLIDLISVCTDHPSASNQILLCSDGHDLSTADLLRRMSNALGKPAVLFPFPPPYLNNAMKFAGKEELARGLLGNLQVDIFRTTEILGWSPPVSVSFGLQKTADWYLSQT